MNKLLKLICAAILVSSNVHAGDSRSTTNIDEMTGKIAYYVTTPSKNEIYLKPPYGNVSGKLFIRKHPRYGVDVLMEVERGQIPCPNYSPCSVLVRFDEKEPKKFEASNPSDGSRNAIFIRNPSLFVNEAKKASSIKIQATFYQNGSQILEFNIEGADYTTVINKPSKSVSQK